jgi:hypothetical protein
MKPLHHHLIKAKLTDLLPTQASIGFNEVDKKRKEWRKLSKKQFKEVIDRHWFPSILGPNGCHYIIDHHHLGMALHLEGQKHVFLTVLKDLSWLDKSSFWKVMEFYQWVHPYDNQGRRISFEKLPVQISDLKDDPYRSLAGLIRDRGAFAKELTPFNEFLWADFLRMRIKRATLKSDLESSIHLACELAKSQEASYLPGWIECKS